MDDREATETSPLLGISAVPDVGNFPNAIPSNAIEINGHLVEDTNPAKDAESQTNSEERAVQYQGMPEVKAKLKYILPALSIGVCGFFYQHRAWANSSQILLGAADLTIVVACSGKIGSDLKSLSNISWISTR